VSNSIFNIVDSTLVVKASGDLDKSIAQDLALPEGKSIAELLHEKEKTVQNQETTKPTE
jgi:hypothetical protein